MSRLLLRCILSRSSARESRKCLGHLASHNYMGSCPGRLFMLDGWLSQEPNLRCGTMVFLQSLFNDGRPKVYRRRVRPLSVCS